MKNQHLLLLCFLALFSCSQAEKMDKKAEQLPFQYELDFQPNILWLVAEDLSPVIPSFGDSTIQTPNVFALTSMFA